jgi:CBS domain-containing protein
VARGLHERGAALLADSVSSVMTAQVHTCSSDANVHSLARMMTDHRVRHVPVVDDGVLVGIVSIGDVVKARLDELEEERKQLVDYIQTP